VYFYEPGESKKEPYFARLELPIFITVSPEISRYKEFTKNGGRRLYMPLLTREELVTIGNFLVKENKVSGLEDFYSKENIEKRYDEFGGIYRHVLPNSIDYVNEIRVVKENYIERLSDETKKKLVFNANIENKDISHLVAQYIVEKKGDEAFQKFTMDFVNDDMPKILKNIINVQSVEDLRDLLIRADVTRNLLANAPYIYEELVAKLHVAERTIEWDKQVLKWDNATTTKNDWTQKYIIMPKDFKKNSLLVKLPTFNEMEYKVLYRSVNNNLPMPDFVYKKKLVKKIFSWQYKYRVSIL
jgi:hypothetical protein